MVDLMERGLTAANVISNALRVGRASDSGWHVGAGNLKTDAVAAAEQICGRQDFRCCIR